GAGLARNRCGPGSVGSGALGPGIGGGVRGLRAAVARLLTLAGRVAGLLSREPARGRPVATRVRAGGGRLSRSARPHERGSPAGPRTLSKAYRAGAGPVCEASRNLRLAPRRPAGERRCIRSPG